MSEISGNPNYNPVGLWGETPEARQARLQQEQAKIIASQVNGITQKQLEDMFSKFGSQFQANVNKNYLKKSENGLMSVPGGKNQYGIDRPDTYLMRGADNKIAEPFRDQVGDSFKKLADYGNRIGSDLDPRAKLAMGGAFGKLQDQAMGTGDLEGIALARQRANIQSLRDMGRLNSQNRNNLNAMQAQMALRGGASGGSMERMGRLAMRNNMMGQQGIAAQNRDTNLNLSMQNANMRNDMLRDVGQVQQNIGQYNANAFTNDQNRRLDALQRAGQVEQDVQSSNINAARSDLDKQNLAAHNIYSEDMRAWAAEKQAQGQSAAARSGGGGGGCCFIFLEARYGNGTMDNVVRRYRDEHMTERNRRGYYKLSEVLVPLMRKSKLAKIAVRLFMTDPLVAYGKAYYGGSKLGYIFKPVVKFWLGTFDYLGGDHEFIRENGEVV